MNPIIAATEVVVYSPLENFFYNTREGQSIAGGIMVLLIGLVVGFVAFAALDQRFRFKQNGHKFAAWLGGITGLVASFLTYNYIF